MDRAELVGTGAALAFHVALVAALSIHLARVDTPPEAPSMEVELVDEVGLTAAAPQSIPSLPPPSEAPEVRAAEPIEPAAAPIIAPPPPMPRVVPTPTPVKRVAPAKAVPARLAPARAAPRASRIGDDFLKGIAADAPSASRATARLAAATFNAAAKADVGKLIAAQIRPCALRQRALGAGAERIRVTLAIRLTPEGRLKGPPVVTGVTGDDDDNRQFVELVQDQAIASYRQCAPLRLPAELYQTAQGGWSNINMTYRLP